MAKHLKSGDFIGRLGGEELLVLLKEVDEIDVEFRVQQLHSAIAHSAPQTNNFQPVSLSASCSYLATSKALSDFNELYAILDQALCQIKRKGNNQIIDAFNAPIYPTTDDSPTEVYPQEMPSLL
nr:diguanylate cyclase [Vibrio taketomensis]